MKHSSKKSGKHDHDPEIDELITRLETASNRLNIAAQRATRRIEALDARLVAAEPGIECWGPTLIREQTTYRTEGSEAPQAAERVVTLGYAKVKKGKWGLTVREVLKSSSGAFLSEEGTLLSKAERNLRLLAAPHLMALTRKIVEAVEAQTVGLEDTDDEDEDGEASRQGSEAAAHADN
jgi:hypothetical protein